MTSEKDKLIGLRFDKEEYFAQLSTNSHLSDIIQCNKDELHVFKQTVLWLDNYFSGQKPDFIPPIRLIGTEFRRKVWHILLDIPYGQVVSYKNVAQKMTERYGYEKISYQAVGNAVAHNPILLIVPCHRVIGTNGSLVGYAAGVDKKRELLKTEGMQTELIL